MAERPRPIKIDLSWAAKRAPDYTGRMEPSALPNAPTPEELEASDRRGTAGRVDAPPWGGLLHFASTRGEWNDPGPILWVDALAEADERERANGDAGGSETPPVTAAPVSPTRAERNDAVRECVRVLASLPVLHLETKWLRQTPREDSVFIYTGSLADVLEAEGLEDAALRLSKLLRTVGSYDYARELLRDAAAWDLSDGSFVSLRMAHAAGTRAAWIDEDPAERERARALLLRWLGYLRGRAPRLPGRPPRGAAPDVSIAESVAKRLELPGPLSIADVSAFATVGRALDDTRVMGASFWAAGRDRWTQATEGPSSETLPADETPPSTETPLEGAAGAGGATGLESLFRDRSAHWRAALLHADLSWLRTRLPAELADELDARVVDEGDA
ncbi:MAG: hypothetical protein R3E97_10895 [Candidatus Eisenbacteria bacterium]